MGNEFTFPTQYKVICSRFRHIFAVLKADLLLLKLFRVEEEKEES